ncbi:hypothetical protein [Intestinimonas butyriciproducens]|uniref:hypothetical protein n=1 Tax=Intestinimonas butyriciproducens TaxID=1297617 RepID=UPI00189F1A26
MGKAKNAVIAGDYQGKAVIRSGNQVQILLKIMHTMDLNKETVESYELVTEDISKSAASGVARGLVGGALLGPVGLLAGGLSAKNKGAYQIALAFKDGKRSLIEVDDKIYKALVASLF